MGIYTLKPDNSDRRYTTVRLLAATLLTVMALGFSSGVSARELRVANVGDSVSKLLDGLDYDEWVDGTARYNQNCGRDDLKFFRIYENSRRDNVAFGVIAIGGETRNSVIYAWNLEDAVGAAKSTVYDVKSGRIDSKWRGEHAPDTCSILRGH